jgi:hypothetical protein
MAVQVCPFGDKPWGYKTFNAMLHDSVEFMGLDFGLEILNLHVR